jgi:hypothetical protein
MLIADAANRAATNLFIFILVFPSNLINSLSRKDFQINRFGGRGYEVGYNNFPHFIVTDC